MLFRAENAESAVQLLTAMLAFKGGVPLLADGEIFRVAAVMVGLLAVHWLMRDRSFEKTARSLPWPVTGMLLAIMLVAMLLSPGEERAFIYFEF